MIIDKYLNSLYEIDNYIDFNFLRIKRVNYCLQMLKILIYIDQKL